MVKNIFGGPPKYSGLNLGGGGGRAPQAPHGPPTDTTKNTNCENASTQRFVNFDTPRRNIYCNSFSTRYWNSKNMIITLRTYIHVDERDCEKYGSYEIIRTSDFNVNFSKGHVFLDYLKRSILIKLNSLLFLMLIVNYMGAVLKMRVDINYFSIQAVSEYCKFSRTVIICHSCGAIKIYSLCLRTS